MRYKALVLHSGGMDSSLCLLLARDQFGADNVLSLGFRYQQRHQTELLAAEVIASNYGIRREVVDMPLLLGWETSSLLTHSLPIQSEKGIPNSFVPGRNGLFLMMASVRARSVGARTMFIGVMEQEGANSGYPDCSRGYIDSVQAVIRHDLSDPSFSIETPLIRHTKAETLELADSQGALEFLLAHTVSCYNGIPLHGCGGCPACCLRNDGIREFIHSHPDRESACKAALRNH